jgi:hypothetical protein
MTGALKADNKVCRVLCGQGLWMYCDQLKFRTDQRRLLDVQALSRAGEV